MSFKTICHSPMKRAKETMNLAFNDCGRTKFEIEELREYSYDTWMEMRSLIAAQQQSPKVSEFFIKTLQGINIALEQPGRVLIIAHGGIHWALCFQLNIINHLWDIDNCGLEHFMPVDNGWKASILPSIS